MSVNVPPTSTPISFMVTPQGMAQRFQIPSGVILSLILFTVRRHLLTADATQQETYHSLPPRKNLLSLCPTVSCSALALTQHAAWQQKCHKTYENVFYIWPQVYGRVANSPGEIRPIP